MLEPGSLAPDIVLNDRYGTVFRLSDLRGRKNVVLFFYPKADTFVCTKEACAFRDHFEEFVSADSEVIGISADDREHQARFAERWSLPFNLLCDTHGLAAEAFGVTKWFGLLKDRVTFVIDKSGVVRAVITGRFGAEHHVREALKALLT
jgi:thioredoxin-dependent peroxiredoxin